MITEDQMRDAAAEAAAAAQHFQLPFGRQAWLGRQGSWLGSGLGSSVDFQDHRAYMPGDDPRHIHWAAYARTEQLTMKLYRAEVAPQVDIVVDVSRSMLENPAKAARTAALLAFCVACADGAAAPVRLQLANGGRLAPVPPEFVRTQRYAPLIPGDDLAGRAPGPLSWRPSALKVLISDLLFPDAPEGVLASMSAGKGLGLVLRPWLPEEASLACLGNIELVDVETGVRRNQRIDEAVAARYRRSYARHLELWEEAARRRGIFCCPVGCDGSLKEALAGPPYRQGAIVLHA